MITIVAANQGSRIVEYVGAAVQLLGFVAALIGIYFTSKPLEQNFIALLVTVAVVFSILNSLSGVREHVYKEHIYAQLMRSVAPAEWFLDTIEDTLHSIVSENVNSRATTLTNEEHKVSITLITAKDDIRPAPLAGIAVLDRRDYEKLSLVPVDSLRKEVHEILFENNNPDFTEANIDSLLSDLKTVYLSSVSGSTNINNRLIKNDDGMITDLEVEMEDMMLVFNGKDLQRLISCTPITRNLEFAVRIAEKRPELLQWISEKEFGFDASFSQCGFAPVPTQ